MCVEGENSSHFGSLAACYKVSILSSYDLGAILLGVQKRVEKPQPYKNLHDKLVLALIIIAILDAT